MRKEEILRVIEIIENYKNPYPEDIYTWDNPEPMNISRGRFNRHVHEVVENTRKEIIKEILEEFIDDS